MGDQRYGNRVMRANPMDLVAGRLKSHANPIEWLSDKDKVCWISIFVEPIQLIEIIRPLFIVGLNV